MCRNIKPLFNFDPPVTPEEVRAASLQFVRKITGFNKPAKANEASFVAAIDEIARISAQLIHSLETTACTVDEKSWLAQLREMGNAKLGRLSRRMQRVREKQQTVDEPKIF